MKNNNIKADNRRALPKFFLIILASALLGGVLGFASAFAADASIVERAGKALSALLPVIAPWGIPVTSFVFLGLALSLYRKGKALCGTWDGEDEDTADTAEEHLSWVLFWTNIQMLLDFFFLSLSAMYIQSMWALRTVVFFFLSSGIIMVFQQKVVDLTRTLNPEKQGSVYDTNFKKKWLQSCDENERRQMGQAAMKSYSVMNVACPVIWCVLMIAGVFFGTGILPSAAVLLLWGISSTTYLLEAIRLGKKN